MITEYFRRFAAFSLFLFLRLFFVLLLFAYCFPVKAHDNEESHKVFTAIGDGYRALMSKEGYGQSVFTLYVNLEITIINESGKSLVLYADEKLGTMFLVGSDGALLTNNHVIALSETRKAYSKKLHDAYAAMIPAQRVTLRFKERYKAVDSTGLTFPVSLLKKSEKLDIAVFQSQKDFFRHRKGFVLEDENKSRFSPTAVPGSPLGITGMVILGNVARTKLYQCDETLEREYLLFISPINGGNSGSPLYNLERDTVNGMVTAYLTSKDGNNSISCAIPSSVLIKFLRESTSPKKE